MFCHTTTTNIIPHSWYILYIIIMQSSTYLATWIYKIFISFGRKNAWVDHISRGSTHDLAILVSRPASINRCQWVSNSLVIRTYLTTTVIAIKEYLLLFQQQIICVSTNWHHYSSSNKNQSQVSALRTWHQLPSYLNMHVANINRVLDHQILIVSPTFHIWRGNFHWTRQQHISNIKQY